MAFIGVFMEKARRGRENDLGLTNSKYLSVL
jgi:hypothetical protein